VQPSNVRFGEAFDHKMTFLYLGEPFRKALFSPAGEFFLYRKIDFSDYNSFLPLVMVIVMKITSTCGTICIKQTVLHFDPGAYTVGTRYLGIFRLVGTYRKSAIILFIIN